MWSKKKTEEPTVEFISTVKGLAGIPDIHPRPTKAFIPQWWKDMPLKRIGYEHIHDLAGTVKMCPSFPEYFSQGFIIPMWTDTVITLDLENNKFKWVSGRGIQGKGLDIFPWDSHPKNQLIDFVTPYSNGEPGNAVLKAIAPWRMVTPPGYSVLQLPVFYEFNKDFSAMPGILHTDFASEINIQLLFHSKKTEIFIERGTPLAQYIPFKREPQLPHIVRDATEADKDKIITEQLRVATKFTGDYLHQKRELSKDKGTHQ